MGMRVNKVALNSWLRTKIESLSISDPTPLSKYILVLVSKDKPEKELKKFCIEQLEELLGSNTTSFVEEMFATAITPSGDDNDPYFSSQDRDERSNRRGKLSSRSRSPSNPTERSKNRRKSPLGRRSRSPLDVTTESNSHRGRHHLQQATSDSKHQPHEYDPGEFNGRFSSHRRRSRSPNNENDQDSDGKRERSSQKLERLQSHHERSSRNRLRGSTTDKALDEPRRRCRNFDERGFCIYGDRCKYDHGSDALVVPGNSAAAWTANLIDTALVATGACLIPRTSPNSSNGVKDVIPEPNTQSTESDDIDASGLPIYTPTPIVEPMNRKPTHLFRQRAAVNKNIIPVPMDNSYEPASIPRQRRDPTPPGVTTTTPPAYEPARADPSDEGANLLADSAEYIPSPITNQQLNPQQPKPHQQCSLLVTKLPWRLNEFQQLHGHFSRFGSLVDIQPHFGGLNSQALVTYSSPAEALAAYRSPDPILSNRFIRLAPWPNGQVFSNYSRGGRFSRHVGAGSNKLGFSQHGQSLLGDAQMSLANNATSRLPVRLRLGENSTPGGVADGNRFFKRSLPGTAPTAERGAGATAPTKKASNRSRWRLERDEDGNPLSDDEDDNDDDADDYLAETELEETAAGDRKRPRSSSGGIGDIDPEDVDPFSFTRNTWNSAGFVGNAEATAALARKKTLWERQKATALKEHQAKMLILEKQKVVRKQAETARKAHLAQLGLELKETIAAVETSSKPDVKRSLMDKVKTLYQQLNEAKTRGPATSVGAGAVSGVGKRSLLSEDAKQQATVQQVLPDTVAAERLEKIAEVKQLLADLEIKFQHTDEASVEERIELRRKITDLKRKLVDLETIRTSDLLAMNAGSSLPGRGQTKLDKRPRTLYVHGLTSYDIEDFKHALVMNYFYTESLYSLVSEETDQLVIEITFCTRDFAEAAMRTFPKFHGRPLEMSFTRPPGNLPSRSSSSLSTAKTAPSTSGKDQLAPPPRNSDVNIEEYSNPLADLATLEKEFQSPPNNTSCTSLDGLSVSTPAIL